MSKTRTELLTELLDGIQDPDEFKNAIEKLIDLEEELNSEQYNYLRGWVCPKCGNVYAPTVSECFRCNKNNWWDPNKIVYASDIDIHNFKQDSNQNKTIYLTTSQIISTGK